MENFFITTMQKIQNIETFFKEFIIIADETIFQSEVKIKFIPDDLIALLLKY
jgi:hypothetical protein